MPGSSVLLTDEDRALLLKVSSLLEEIVETLDILEDEDAMKSIKEAEEDVKAGRVRGYNEFVKELRNLERYTVKVTRRFEINFRKLDIQLKRRSDSTISPHLGKPLRGELSGKRSLRIGDYRIIYIIDEHEKTVTLYNVRHRKVASDKTQTPTLRGPKSN